MKLSVQRVIDVTLVVSTIIREARPLPTRGLFWLARTHAKLLPEYTIATERRDAMITAYDTHTKVVGGQNDDGMPIIVDGPDFCVPADKMDEFNAAWKEIGDQEIEVDVQPISLAHLDLGDGVAGSITANELIGLGELIAD